MHPIFTLMLSNHRSNQPRFAQCLGGGILRSYWLICFTNEFDWFIITRALENQEVHPLQKGLELDVVYQYRMKNIEK
jgi:hypothetical protein